MRTAFVNARVYPVSAEPFDGFVTVSDGIITGMGSGRPDGEFDRIEDLGGRALLPGFIDAHTHEGMIQGEIGGAGDDINEMSDPVTPHLRAIDGINPADPSLREALDAGITLVNTGPGSANVIGGQFAVIRPVGRIIDEMIVKQPSCLKIAFGENPKDSYAKHEKEPQTRMAIAALLREWLIKAQDYADKWKRFLEDPEDEEKRPEHDLKLEILRSALAGEIAVHAHAHRADDIASAIRIAEEFGLRLVLIHATEGHRIADYIAARNIPCVVGPSFPGREKPEMNEIGFETAGILAAAGVKVALQSDTYPPLKYFHSIICMAVKYGMRKEDALRAVTLSPAEILGIDDAFGSIAAGKRADLIVFSGSDPLDFYATVEQTYIDGIRAR